MKKKQIIHNGFSIPELLITLAISTIIVGAAFGSYLIVSHNYRVQKDIQYMSDLARPAVNMIAKDVRMAGYRDDTAAAIINPITIIDSGTAACCDSMDIVYDIGEGAATERLLIKYFAASTSHNADDIRLRLWKQIRQCTNSECTTFAATDPMPPTPIADYVDDLQFIGGTGDCQPALIPQYGCSVERYLTPSTITQGQHPNGSNSAPDCGGDINKLRDGSYNSVWSCILASDLPLFIMFEFANYVRVKEINLANAAHIMGGSMVAEDANYTQAIYPYGVAHPITTKGSFQILQIDGTCVHPTCSTMVQGDRTNIDFRCFGLKSLTDTSACTITTVPPAAAGGASNLSFADENFGKYATKRVLLMLYGTGPRCTYADASDPCNPSGNVDAGLKRSLAEVKFLVDEYGSINTRDVQIGLMLRSPSEHGSVDRSGNKTLGNRLVTWDDRYIRDFFSTSVVARNVYYQAQ